MSESEKTLPPTRKKIRKAREEGQVAKSADVLAGISLVGIGVTLLVWGGKAWEHLSSSMGTWLERAMSHPPITPEESVSFLGEAATETLYVLGPILAVVFVLALATNLAQVGFLVSFKAISPKLERVDLLKGLKSRFFSGETYINLLLVLAKVLIILVVLFWVVRSELREILMLTRADPASMLGVGRVLFGSILIKLAILLAGIAFLDFKFRGRQHRKKLMMSQREVKDEHKSDEGDPQLKQQRRQRHLQLLRNHRMIAQIPSADVTACNPTSVAVTLKYERGGRHAPRVVAAGRGGFAQEIVAASRRHGVPVRRHSVVHALIRVEVGEEIPPQLDAAVRELLLWAYEKRAGDPDQTPSDSSK